MKYLTLFCLAYKVFSAGPPDLPSISDENWGMLDPPDEFEKVKAFFLHPYDDWMNELHLLSEDLIPLSDETTRMRDECDNMLENCVGKQEQNSISRNAEKVQTSEEEHKPVTVETFNSVVSLQNTSRFPVQDLPGTGSHDQRIKKSTKYTFRHKRIVKNIVLADPNRSINEMYQIASDELKREKLDGMPFRTFKEWRRLMISVFDESCSTPLRKNIGISRSKILLEMYLQNQSITPEDALIALCQREFLPNPPCVKYIATWLRNCRRSQRFNDS